MQRGAMAFVDRLAERGLVDRFGFLCFAFGGAALIVLAKALSVPPLIVALCAAAAIVVYAIIVQRTGTGRLRSDQAGDNCYYLGLIYTLASLAYAIFTFDPAGTATTIIQGFGVALATTIIGLVLRVYFNQSRPDIAESETSARLELAAAAGKLKAELSRSVVSMNDFSRQTRQSLEELRDEIITSVQTTKQTAETALNEASAQATSAVIEQSDLTVSRSKKLSTATDKIVGGMENHAAKLSDLTGSQTAVAASLAALEQAATNSQRILETLAVRSEEIGQSHTEAVGTSRELGVAAAALQNQVESLGGSVGRLEAALTQKIEDVQSIPRGVADAAIDAMSSAIERVRTDLQSIVEAQASIVAGLADHAQGGADMVSRHNQALETELARSRENVTKVHSALVDMTSDLAKRAEASVG